MAIADKKEILEFFTMVMRGENPEGVTANTFKAAELMGKYYGLFKGPSDDEQGGDVIIVDDIGTDGKNKSQ